MIKVSIVVPVYNVENYLRKCLNSLAAQTLKEIEVIVVNDGTKDHSQTIIDEFVQRYPRTFRSFIKENGGLSDARNYGIAFCQGEYIGFVDSDDYVEPEMYEAMYNEASKLNADMVICDYLKEYPAKSIPVCARKYDSAEDMLVGGLAAAWNKIYRRELVERTGVLFPKGLIYEDTEFYCKLIPHVSVCGYVNKPFVHYVQREGSIVNSHGEKIGMIFEIFDHIRAYYFENDFYDSYKMQLEYFIIRVLLGSSMERICGCTDAKQRKQLLGQTIDYLDHHLGAWRKNCYLSDYSSKRNIYMKSVRQWNIFFIAAILRRCLATDKKLF